MRWLTTLFTIVIVSGCREQSMPPTLRPIAKISARVHAVADFGLEAIASVEVPPEDMKAFATLITPSTPCLQTIHHNMHFHVADIYLQHHDGSTTTLLVRWTGHNPAAISLNDRDFFYGGSDAFPDGAIRIVRLLKDYYHRSRK